VHEARHSAQKLKLNGLQKQRYCQTVLLLAAAQDCHISAVECGRADIIIANIEPFLENPLRNSSIHQL